MVADANGTETTLHPGRGLTVMEAIRAHGVPSFGECGGSLACATCHVVVAAGWAARMPAMTDDEEAMLDTAFNVTPTSRLSCQIVVTNDLDGLRVSLPA